MNIQYKENVLTPEDFIRLRIAVGRTATPQMQAEAALRTGLYNITAFCEGTAVAMGRLVGDGAMYWYIQDMAVLIFIAYIPKRKSISAILICFPQRV